MAALDFPATPTNGQVFTSNGSSWTYDSTKVAWRSSPYEPGAAITSATAPTTPQNGDIWFNTNDGTLYTYYNDGTTAQWVEVRSEIATSQVGLAPIVPSSIVTASGTATVSSSGLVTFTGSSSISLNGCFSSSFANYFIVFDFITSVDSVPNFRLRASGTDATTGYSAGRIYQIDGSIGGQNNGTGGSWGLTPTNVQKFEGNMTLYKPNQVANTHGHHSMFMVSSNSSVTTIAQQQATQAFLSTTSFDGMTLYPSVGTGTGTVKVYGYN